MTFLQIKKMGFIFVNASFSLAITYAFSSFRLIFVVEAASIDGCPGSVEYCKLARGDPVQSRNYISKMEQMEGQGGQPEQHTSLLPTLQTQNNYHKENSKRNSTKTDTESSLLKL